MSTISGDEGGRRLPDEASQVQPDNGDTVVWEVSATEEGTTREVRHIRGSTCEDEGILEISETVSDTTSRGRASDEALQEAAASATHEVTVLTEAQEGVRAASPQPKKIVFKDIVAREQLIPEPNTSVQNYVTKLQERVSRRDPALEMPEEVALKIIQRFQQIKKGIGADFENTLMSDYDILHMAFFLEVERPRIEQAAGRVLQRGATGLSRTLQVDAKSRVVYIWAKHKISKLHGTGGFKKVVSAVGIPLENMAETIPAARVFTKVIRSETTDLENTRREVAIARDLNFIKMHACCEYTYKNKAKVPSMRISMIYDLANGSLFNVCTDHKNVSIERKYSLMKDVIDQLTTMHGKGIFHGDLKLQNILNGEHAAITDFGFSRAWGEKKGPLYEEGYYGSIRHTAPELFGKKNFSGNPFDIDTFAAGVTMYALRFGRLPDWTATIKACRNGERSDLQKCQEEVLEAIWKKIGERIGEIIRATSGGERAFTTEEKYDLVMYRMLCPDPQRRLTSDPLDTTRESVQGFIERLETGKVTRSELQDAMAAKRSYTRGRFRVTEEG